MDCPICDRTTRPLFSTDAYHVVKCDDRACGYIGLDLDRWEYPYSDKDYYQEIPEERIDRAALFVLRRAKFVKDFWRGGKLAELGAGLGETAIGLSDAGFDVWGVEESRNAVEFLKGKHPSVNWVCDGIREFLKLDNRFDVLTMFHVLEHIPNPRETVSLLKRNLTPGGGLIVEVPDVSSGRARYNGRNWERWNLHHVNYFSLRSLKRLLEPFGFRLVGREPMYHMGWPQGVLWKDATMYVLARLGIYSDLRTAWKLEVSP